MSQSLETVTTESLKAQNDGSCSEPELLEEEVHGGLATVVIIVAACVVWLVVSFVEDLLHGLLEGFSGLWVAKLVLGDDLLELLTLGSELSGDLESGRQEMVVVHQLNEWLDLGPSGDLLLTHSLVNLEWCSLYAGNKGVGVRLSSLLSIIEILDYNGFLSSSSSGE